MSSSPEIPRTGISPQAQDWLAANPPAPRLELTAENAADVRSAIREGWAPAMAAARAEFGVAERSVDVGGVDCVELVGDRGPAGTVLYFYGGGHTVGSPEEDVVITAALASTAAVRVVAPRYPLAPEAPYPAAVDCAETVYRALLETIDPTAIVIAGESAGGNLALALFQRIGRAGLPQPAAFVLLSPWADMAFTGDSHRTNRDPTLVLTDGDLAEMASLYRGTTPADDPMVSPIHADFTSMPPTFMTTGTRDLLLSDATRLDRAMRLDGVDVTLRVWEGMWHVFEFYRELPEARASVAEIGAWIRARLDDQSSA